MNVTITITVDADETRTDEEIIEYYHSNPPELADWVVVRQRGELERVFTPAQQEAQRRSFAFGNTHFENERITRETVDRAAEALKRDHATKLESH